MDTQAIRADRKLKRSQLPADCVALASVDVAARLWRLPALARARRIAAYVAVDGEIDCQYAIEMAWLRHREVYLPVLKGKQLRFAKFCAETRFSRNRYGIPEPICAQHDYLKASQLDVVLTPLVAFDARGNRIGMGAGFYDRAFAFVKRRKYWLQPNLIGIAHDFQKAAQIKASGWDVPLHYVVTDEQTYICR